MLDIGQEQEQKSVDKGEHGRRHPQLREGPFVCIQGAVQQDCKLQGRVGADQSLHPSETIHGRIYSGDFTYNLDKRPVAFGDLARLSCQPRKTL